MRWLNRLIGTEPTDKTSPTILQLIELESRDVPDATAIFTGGILTVTGGDENNHILVTLDATTSEIVVQDKGQLVTRVAADQVTQLNIITGDGRNSVRVADTVVAPIFVNGGADKDLIIAGGGLAVIQGGGGDDKIAGGLQDNTLLGNAGRDLLIGGNNGPNVFDGGDPTPVMTFNSNMLAKVMPTDAVIASVNDAIMNDVGLLGAVGFTPTPAETITADEVATIIARASAATSTNDAIIAIVDRNGRILGVGIENGVALNIQQDDDLRTFAIDGAVAKARTAAFFANNMAPLTSRTIRSLSETTITQREVMSNPSITDPNSNLRGPGFVAPVGIGAHFPRNIANTPEVDLFAIEHTNRDGSIHPGPDRIKGTADDIPLNTRLIDTDPTDGVRLERSLRFDSNPQFVQSSGRTKQLTVNGQQQAVFRTDGNPQTVFEAGGQELFAPESYGFVSGIRPNAQARGIGTSPGGIPIYKNGQLVGGIGVFFPGATGFATEENSSLGTTFDATKPDRTLEAEFIGLAAVGGAPGIGRGVGPINGIALSPSFAFPLTADTTNQRIDLVGIQLEVVGPGGILGIQRVIDIGTALGTGPAAFNFAPVSPGDDGTPGTGDEELTINGLAAAEGWLVMPHDGVGISKEEATAIILNGINQANITRAAIRLPKSSATRMVFTVADATGEIVAQFRMPDATIFSIDVSTAKARNVAYYADPNQLQPEDQLDGIPPGTNITSRTIRFLALPRFPSAVDGAPIAPFSILGDGGVDPLTGRNVGDPLPASAFGSVLGFDAFNPGTNFRQGGPNPDPNVIRKQNGIVFFPGSVPLYRGGQLIGGFGVSGDGVDQDDVVTQAGSLGFEVPAQLLRADEVFINGVRLPYDKSLRNPEGI